ncbi:uncharacterized protein Z520_06985 [Fonsecaea multimorphosa CBS 102226]|uniref:FAD-binding PCMH-type domain-containing protein n=1 Tax=Fonsecaea multimorphosa CBS 102226 TaxID=1442371 RepID=A0A0D2KLJ1_9EURO|nr:uncharacterized protein Z520_06985 [Fonsecaea multimorphosa CBS 102226]KIX97533.1 hypothetical protein Z520_06985 [Fonsecaea multimorphosa CBS 102226]OAL23493.1 hypothetical protein AYO22_06543 [Fonsecaea multimorphosa]
MDADLPTPFNLSHIPGEIETTNKTLSLWYNAIQEKPAVEYLPPGISRETFLLILKRFQEVLGEDAVIVGDELRLSYADPFSMNADEAEKRGSSCAIRPTTVEQIQAIVKIANEYEIPLWTVSRGKNLGYGGPAARVKGSVILDLQNMNKVLDINDKYSYYTVEPGVSFFQLYQAIKEQKKDIWCSVPALGWGSVVGNALDRGWGYTPHGDHSNQICGIEAVLADGSLVRTGMGALKDSKSWPLFRGGYGPTYDQMFNQSNFGIVTKLTLWASPAPEGLMLCHIDVPEEHDLKDLVDILRELLLHDKIQNHPVIGNIIREICRRGPRSQWYDGPGSIPDERLKELQHELGIGFWDAIFGLYGPKEIIEHNYKACQEALKAIKGSVLTGTAYYPKEKKYLAADEVPYDLQAGVPSMAPLRTIEFRGLDGGHISFSPVLPSNGQDALDFYHVAKYRCAQHGFDFVAGLHLHLRHLTHINMIHFDRQSQEDKDAANNLFVDLVHDARKAGYGEYRAHVEHMDLVADQYDFNEGALMRLNERIKDCLDPKGILSPGKQGIWPAAYRKARKQELSNRDKGSSGSGIPEGVPAPTELRSHI